MIKIKKIYIILGISGCRKDFVTGWLGTLPNFINTRWHINLATGGSFNDLYFIKDIDAYPNMILRDLLSDNGVEISKESNFNLAISFHGLDLINNLKGLDENEYEILNINTDDEDLPTIFWEQFVKNFLRYNNTVDQMHGDNYTNKTILKFVSSVGNISELSREEQIKIIKSLYPNFDSTDPSCADKIKNSLMLWCEYLDQVKVKYINYNDIFITGGSIKLCEVLDISAPEVNHQYWDAMLPFAKTKDEIIFLDEVWKKSDFIK